MTTPPGSDPNSGWPPPNTPAGGSPAPGPQDYPAPGGGYPGDPGPTTAYPAGGPAGAYPPPPGGGYGSDPSQYGSSPYGSDPSQGYGAPSPAYGMPAQPAYGVAPAMGGMYGADPTAPYGYDPQGRPYSDKSKIVAGVLQLLIGTLGIGRFYTGHTGIAVAQLLTCGGCGIWALVDGILILVNGGTDAMGRPLRDGT